MNITQWLKIGLAQSRKIRKALKIGFLCGLGDFARKWVAEFVREPMISQQLKAISRK